MRNKPVAPKFWPPAGRVGGYTYPITNESAASIWQCHNLQGVIHRPNYCHSRGLVIRAGTVRLCRRQSQFAIFYLHFPRHSVSRCACPIPPCVFFVSRYAQFSISSLCLPSHSLNSQSQVSMAKTLHKAGFRGTRSISHGTQDGFGA
jgi:hypothetical protein